jgi:hypothetical protein
MDEMPDNAAGYASSDYITTFAGKVTSVLTHEMLGHVRNIFRMASYKKGLIIGTEEDRTERVVLPVAPQVFRLEYQWSKKAVRGVFSEHPTLPSVRGMLDQQQLEAVILFLTGKRYGGGIVHDTWLWGADSGVIVSLVNNNFDDLCQLAKVPVYSNSSLIAKVELPRVVHY